MPQGAADAIKTLAVQPDRFAHVAALPRERDRFDLTALGGSQSDGMILQGGTLSVTIDSIAIGAVPPPGATEAPPAPPAGPPPTPPPGADPSDGPVFVTTDRLGVVALIADASSQTIPVDLGSVPTAGVGPTQSFTLTTPISCSRPCSLVGLGIEHRYDDPALRQGTLVVRDVHVDRGLPVRIGSVAQWQPGSGADSGDNFTEQIQVTDAGSPTALGLRIASRSGRLVTQTTVRGGALPALVYGTPARRPTACSRGWVWTGSR
ncbi:hypothetical protein MM440_08455 [Arsenicicoccus piscis]|uniref:hypothetical protein n=1 Tax=Arsenicicoccus piscis TaxID=673954 RepID=UPI001F4D3395|nr:hypothetical protein [Arsenicicoccus piscis]MCH8627815.1 hypothetical protein [Arsenicicoccus piscis]